MQLVLVLSDGRVLTCHTPERGWEDSRLRIPNRPKAMDAFAPLDLASFTVPTPTGDLLTGQFQWKGKLVLSAAVLPSPVKTVYGINPSGEYLLGSVPHAVAQKGTHLLRRRGQRWETVLKGMPYWSFAQLDRTGRYICAGNWIRVGVNTNATNVHVYRITSRGLKEIGLSRSSGQLERIIPGKDGWFLDYGYWVGRIPILSFSYQKDNYEQEYGSGRSTGPLIGNEIALFQQEPEAQIVFQKRVVAKVPKYRRDRRTDVLYWPDVGSAFLSEEDGGVYVNDRLIPYPKTDGNAWLFAVQGET